MVSFPFFGAPLTVDGKTSDHYNLGATTSIAILGVGRILVIASTGGFFEASADLARGIVGQLISSCWRTGENAKDRMSSTKKKSFPPYVGESRTSRLTLSLA